MPSGDGCLGRGIYVAREDKATRFAKLREPLGGGLIELLVRVQNPKFVIANDSSWQSQGLDHSCYSHPFISLSALPPTDSLIIHANNRGLGYDACRAESTSASTNMEWCIKDASQITVIDIRYLG